MNYDNLASLYDELVGDEQAINDYVSFINEQATFKSVLELGCGSGEVAIKLAEQGKIVDASDISEPMLDVAKSKSNKVNFFKMDMRKLHQYKKYDLVICLCDSLNYLRFNDLSKLFKEVYEVLNEHGTFIFDMHSLDRLKEFEEEFYEAGMINHTAYTWSIISEDNYLYQNFIFYDEDNNAHYESHVQEVFDPQTVLSLLSDFKVEIYTDFTLEGIKAGEKYFIVARKG